MQSRSSALAGSVLALLALAPEPRAQAVVPYTITDVSGPLPGEAIGYASISDTGFVCGWQLGPNGSTGFRWSPHGGVAQVFDSADLGWGDHTSIGVNSAGVVIGLYGATTGGLSLTSGYVWQNGVAKELLTPLGFRGQPAAINDAGWIVGRAGLQPGGTPGAVRWAPDRTPSFVGDLDHALDINARGQIVGYRTDRTTFTARAFLWDAGTQIPLGTLDPTNLGSVIPRAIDGLGRVVGSSRVQGRSRAFLWTSATGMRELAYPISQPFHAEATDINDAGWIVGSVEGGAIWAPDGSVHALEPLVPDVGLGQPWTQLLGPMRINSRGQIAGWGVRRGRVVWALLTPAELQASLPTFGGAGAWSKVTVSGLTSGRKAFLAAEIDDGLDRGYSVIPRCGGFGLAMAKPVFIARGVADANGAATFAWRAPLGLTGATLKLQAVQPGGCAVSNLVRVTL